MSEEVEKLRKELEGEMEKLNSDESKRSLLEG